MDDPASNAEEPEDTQAAKQRVQGGGRERGGCSRGEEASPSISNAPWQSGTQFGDYELLEPLGHGGMGVVYKARQRSLDRIVAIKMMAFGPTASPEFIKRFRAEAVSAAALHHQNIVAIHEVGIHQGQHFFVMEFVEGQSLARLAGGQPLPARRATAYLKAIAQAVHYAHERGILHRDLKPANVLIDLDDQPRVVDFGLARRLDADSELTVTGQVLGSPSYLPPEQAAGRRAHVSRRTDVYGLGATLYHLLTGRPPFQAESLAQTLALVLHDDPVPPRLLNPSVPRDLETICLKCLEKEPGKRYPTAQEVSEELGRFLEGQPILARPLGMAGKAWRWCRRNPQAASLAAVAVLVFMLGLTGVLWQWRQSESNRRRAETESLLARRDAYAADMKEAQRALEDHDLRRARELLDAHRPAAKSEVDLRSWEWRYLWTRCRSVERFTLHQYTNPVSALAFSADGKWLAVRLADAALVLWDAVEQRPRRELPVEGRPFCKALAFSPRGSLLAWGHENASGTHVVSVLDLSTQKEVASLPHTHLVASLAFSPDAHALATLAYDGTVRIWDLDSQQVLSQFLTTKVDIRGNRFATVTDAIDPPAAGAPFRRPNAPEQRVTHFVSTETYTDHYGCVRFSPDGRWLAVGEAGPQIRLRDRITGKERLISVSAPADGITALAFSPDSRRLAAACGASDNDIHIWDLASGAEMRLIGHSGWIVALAFSPDGQTLASASTDQTVRLWDLRRQTERRQLQGNVDEVWAVAWSPDGQNLVTGARDGSIRYWDPAPKPDPPYLVLPQIVHYWGPTFFPDSRSFLAATGPEGAVVRWDAASGQALEKLTFLGTNHTSLDLSPNGRWLALGNATGKIQVWDFHARQLVTNLVFPGAQIFALWFTARGNLLASGAVTPEDRIAGKIWTVAGWKEFKLSALNVENVFDGNFSSDERTLALGYTDGTAAWWDLATGKRKAFFPRQSPSYVHAVFSPDGRYFATAGGLDGLMTLWDTATRRARPIGHSYRNALHDLIFSPDSRRLIASGTSPREVIKFWDVETGRDLATLPGVPGWYLHVGFSPDGNTLFAASFKGTVLLWHAPSFAEIEAKERKERLQ